jgi:hypothetical protein
MSSVRIVRASFMVLLLACSAGACSSKSTRGTSATTSATPTDRPIPAPIVNPCVLSVAEIKLASKLELNEPKDPTSDQCMYDVATKPGTAARLEIRIKPSVSDADAIETQRNAAVGRTVTNIPSAGRSAIVLEPTPALADVTAYVLTNSGLVAIKFTPGAEPTKDDTKAVINLVALIAKKLDLASPDAAPTPTAVQEQPQPVAEPAKPAAEPVTKTEADPGVVQPAG